MTVWIGALWSVGYVLVPFLFYALDNDRLAADAAGELFAGVSAIGVVCGILLTVGALTRASAHGRALRSPRVWILGVMMLLVLVEFLLQPMMEVLRDAGMSPGSEEAAQFATLHAISSVVYFIMSILGLLLVVLGHRDNFREAE